MENWSRMLVGLAVILALGACAGSELGSDLNLSEVPGGAVEKGLPTPNASLRESPVATDIQATAAAEAAQSVRPTFSATLLGTQYLSEVPGGAVEKGLPTQNASLRESPVAPDIQATAAAETAQSVRPTFSTILLGTQSFRLEILSAREELARGLGGRASLDADMAVLFAFDPPQILQFWMKDVQFPIDVLFIDDQGVITDVHTMNPELGLPDALLTRYSSSADVVYAVEINGGLAGQLGVAVGGRVELQ
jgi:uncharacterized membrane protein (UPF0127 family)